MHGYPSRGFLIIQKESFPGPQILNMENLAQKISNPSELGYKKRKMYFE